MRTATDFMVLVIACSVTEWPLSKAEARYDPYLLTNKVICFSIKNPDQFNISRDFLFLTFFS
jgi:hypothetical protein